MNQKGIIIIVQGCDKPSSRRGDVKERRKRRRKSREGEEVEDAKGLSPGKVRMGDCRSNWSTPSQISER